MNAISGAYPVPAASADLLHEPPPMSRWVLYALLGLVAVLFLWAGLGRLDIVAVGQGKLVPATYVKIVQPAESGILQEILVSEGQHVRAGQVLMRMDAAFSDADRKAVLAEVQMRGLALRRIDAELAGQPFRRLAGDSEDDYLQAAAQHLANRQALAAAVAQEQGAMERARHDLAAAEQVRAKLAGLLPHYRSQEQAYDALAQQGFMGRLMADEKVRERVEQEQDLVTQESRILSARATMVQSERSTRQIVAENRMQLRAERVEHATQLEKLRQELAKQERRNLLTELKAPQDGVIKDLATHTAGTVVSPGTILMTLVPDKERLRAEVWVRNEDVGFVRPGQAVKLKLAAFQFQKYGMVDGRVAQVGADAADGDAGKAGVEETATPLLYRTLVDLDAPELLVDGRRYALRPGMQVAAEVNLGDRSVLEYVLSPIRKAFHEAGRER